MRNKLFKDSLVVGLALFCMFFGAGNLIFPPYLGNKVGQDFLIALFGFLLTGVGLPIIAIIACAKIDGSFEDMALRVSKPFMVIATTAIILAIGPIIAIPRTASTAFEIGVQTLAPSIPQVVVVVVYFFIALLFVLKPSKLVNMLGKIVTPILLFALIAMFTKGMISPIGESVALDVDQAFTESFKEGYNTMDALGAVLFGTVIISAIKSKGYVTEKEKLKVAIGAGIVAGLALIVIYSGLMYLGSQTSGLEVEMARTELLVYIANTMFGQAGLVLLSITAILACITTAITLLIIGAKFFTELSKGKVSYTVNAIILTVVSALLALNDVEQIVALAGPILEIMYPVVMVLTFVALFNDKIKSDFTVRMTVYVTLAFSVITMLSSMFGWELLTNILAYVPLQSSGFGWIVPALITFIILTVSPKNKTVS